MPYKAVGNREFPKSKPKGKAIPWDDDALDRISQITQEDIEAARMIVPNASDQLSIILDAEPIEELEDE